MIKQILERTILVLSMVFLIIGCNDNNLIQPELSNHEDNCEFNDKNIKDFFNRLHNFMHKAKNNQEIINFIDEDFCVRNGIVDWDNLSTIIRATWVSNNKTIELNH